MRSASPLHRARVRAARRIAGAHPLPALAAPFAPLVFATAALLSLALGACSADGGGGSTLGVDRDPPEGAAGSSPDMPGGIAGPGAGLPGEFLPGAAAGSEMLDPVVDPCLTAGCGPGQTCILDGDGARCEDLSCEELACSATEECRPEAQGGNICANIFCELDVDCEPSDYCAEGGVCQPDVCSGGARFCRDQDVLVCASNGGSQEVPFRCGGAAYFETTCTEPVPGRATCTCEDDWDCPAFTVCEAGQCIGTGLEPTCTLPPTDFADTQPAVELHWGGDSSDDDGAHDGSGDGSLAPWPASSHVQATPMVANLDDDNGDGLINELDFPEVIFVTYQSGAVDNSGILRAIHGGGPRRGKDFFAVCGNTVWHEGDPLPAGNCTGDGRSRSPAAVGDIDGDGSPEIVQITTNNQFRLLSATGDVLIQPFENQPAFADGGISLSPSLANLDFAGLPELVLGRTVLQFGVDADGDLFVERRYEAAAGTGGTNSNEAGNRGGPMTCIADLAPNPGQEILAGPTLYRIPNNPPACANPPCQAALQTVWSAAAVNGASLVENQGLCAVADLWGANPNVAPGPDNPPDGNPEAIFIAEENLIILDGATGAIIHQRSLAGSQPPFDPASGVPQRPRGGAPNIDDFDGDGFLEVASALARAYVVVDLQNPTGPGGACPAWPTSLDRAAAGGQTDNPNLTGANLARDPGGVGGATLPSGAVEPGSCQADADCGAGAVCNQQKGSCTCLHNGWHRENDDASSALTSSSVFDFNGDGAAEVLYNDECDFRIFDGLTGAVLFSTVSRGRTFTENPVVADVDNDGNAEIVTFANTEQLGEIRCVDDATPTPEGPNGIRVWGDPQDTWVSARRIYNQQSYHVTNVTESGAIVARPPESWLSFAGQRYNTYRSQPRSFGVAPDLAVTAVGLFSPDAQCGTLENQINITFEVENRGDLRVGAGVQMSFVGVWDGVEEPLSAAGGAPLVAVLADGLEPGRSLIDVVSFDVSNQATQTRLPDSLRVTVDTGGTPGSGFGAQRECNEANNSLLRNVEPGEQLPDLSVAAGEAVEDCGVGSATLQVTVSNTGVAPASGVVVQIFAGNPTRGGTLLVEQVVEGSIAPQGQRQLEIVVRGLPRGRAIELWAAVDPRNVIGECNESNNTDPADNPAFCADLR